MLPVLARINPCELAALVGLPFDELIFSVVCGMEIHPTLMTIIRGGANIGLNLTDVVEIDGDLWAVLEWNTHEEPLLKVMLNRRFWEDMEDGTWLYQMPVVWPELGEAAG